MADLTVRGDPRTELDVIATWDGAAEVELSFGDGTPPVPAGRGPVAGRKPVRHAYAAAGAYMVTATGSDGTVAARVQVYVRPGTAPAVTITVADDNPGIIEATFDDTPADLISTYLIDHGDEQHTQRVAPPGTVVPHGYRPGDYTIAVKDIQAGRWLRHDITVEQQRFDPEFSITGTGRHAKATITRLVTPGKDVLFDWGDGDQSTITAAQLGDAAEHDYAFDDYYIIQCVYSDGSTDGSAQDVTIPLGRGVKPVPRLDWTPDAADPLAVRLKWVGSGWHYRIRWGDGTEDRVLWTDPPKRHRYDSEGTYRVVCVSDLHQEWTISGEVTVRAFKTPVVSATHVANGLVRLSITDPGEPVLHRVTWNTGGQAEEYGAGVLSPTHQYTLGTPRPTITVEDVPAKRKLSFLGPDIPAPPPPKAGPQWSFHPTYLPPQHTSGPTSVTGSFKGRDLKPNTAYEVRMSWSTSSDNYAKGTSDADGNVECVIATETGWTVQSGSYFGPWRHFFGYEAADPAGTYTYIPVTNRQDGVTDPCWYYRFDTDDPWRFHVSVQSPIAGTYRIDWGDSRADDVTSDGRVCWATHTYDRVATDVTITVTAPNGKTNSKRITAVGLKEPWICRNNSIYADACCSIDWLGQSGYHTPITATWGYEDYGAVHDWNDGMPYMWTTHSYAGSQALSQAYKSAWRGREMTVTCYGPLQDPVSKTLTPPTPPAARARLTRDDPWIKTISGTGFDPGEELTIHFQATREGYFADGDPKQYLNSDVVRADAKGAFAERPYRYLGDWMWRAGAVVRADGTMLYFDTPWQSEEPLLVTFDYPARDGYTIVPAVDPLVPGGVYRIDWGDGTAVETTATGMGLDVWHRYDGAGPYRLTITDPTSRTGSRLIYRPALKVARSDFRANKIDVQQGDIVDGEYFCPVKIDWTSNLDGDVFAEHLRSPHGWRIKSYEYPPGTAAVTVGMPLSEPQVFEFEIPQVKNLAVGPSRRDWNQVDVRAWWMTITPGALETTGQIRFRNDADAPVARCAVAFTLPKTVTVADVWCAGDAGYAQTGPTRWEVSARLEQPVEPGKQGSVGLRVDHELVGDDFTKPTDIAATTWTASTTTIEGK